MQDNGEIIKMEVVTKIITAMGALVSIGGLGWAFLGAMEFFQGKKIQNAQQADNGMAGMIYVGERAYVSVSIAAIIVVAINSIQF